MNQTVSGLVKCLLFLLIIIPFSLNAQNFPGLDKSPADIAYFKSSGEVVARVIYSRPQAKGRDIFGGLEKYGKVWRTGANECTEITFYKDVNLGGQAVKAGSYSLFTIPNESEWTIILNKDLHQWGAYRYKEEQDVLRVQVPSQKTGETIEAFSILFQKSDNGADLLMAWDDTMVAVPIGL